MKSAWIARFTASANSFLLVLFVGFIPLQAQWGDLSGWGGVLIPDENGNSRLSLSLQMRSRYEAREGVRFGKKPDEDALFTRLRLGLSYKPVRWLKFSGMVNDSRAAFFGPAATASERDLADLQEGYFELLPDEKRGFGMTAGRKMLKYGDGRLIATSPWGNVNTSFDHARLYYRLPKARVEFLFVSPVKAREQQFNRPVLGDHLWGTYNAFPNLFGKTLVEGYALRRYRNRPGGFTGGNPLARTDRVEQNVFGFRLKGPLGQGVQQTLEGVLQTGEVGPASHRAWGWASNLSRGWSLGGKPLTVRGEYKFASGTHNPNDPTRSGSFDNLYPSNHDRFGHQDLFGWRNVHNVQSLVTLGLVKDFSLNMMYNNSWLASTRDALYTSSGTVIAQDRTGAAGRHVGQEWDAFVTYKYKYHEIGIGYGYFFKGEFIRNTTPGVTPIYVYVFHSYGF